MYNFRQADQLAYPPTSGGGAEQAESLCRRSFQLELVGGLLARAWKCLDHSVLGFLVVW